MALDFYKDSVDKQIKIEFDGGTITNTEIHQEQFELVESLCSESQLKFGCCETSSIKFKISNVFTPLKDKWLTVSMTLERNTDEPFLFGKYKVYSDVPTADRKYRNVTAYDSMYDILNTNVADWYNFVLPNTDSKVTLKEFRDSFFQYFEIEQDNVSLPQDSMVVEKTIDPSEISGKDVITAICELNGRFGHIGHDGKFYYIYLGEMIEGLYPRNDLFPRNDIYPADPMGTTKISGSYYITAQYEDYRVRKINKLQIRQKENDIGYVVGDGDNCYIVEDNFLVYGKNNDDLKKITEILFAQIKNVWYQPASVSAMGNPMLTVGDGIHLRTRYEIIYTYILERTLKGIQALRDEYSAQGKEYYSEKNNSVNKSIIQLKGKTNTLTRTVEETRLEIKDVEKELSSSIQITAQELESEFSKQITETKEYADTQASAAEKNAKDETTEKLKSYSTTTQMNSVINQSAESIKTTVNKQITETKEYADTQASAAEKNAKDETTEKLKSYSTTTQMNSAIEQKADSITESVSATYETKTDASINYTELSGKIELTSESIQAEVTRAQNQEVELAAAISVNASGIATKVSKGDVSSQLEQEADGFTIRGNRIAIQSTNFTLTADGKVKAIDGEFSGSLTSGSDTSSQVKITGGRIGFLNNKNQLGSIAATTTSLSLNAPIINGTLDGFLALSGGHISLTASGSMSGISLSANSLVLGISSLTIGNKVGLTEQVIIPQKSILPTTVMTGLGTATPVTVMTGILQIGDTMIPQTTTINTYNFPTTTSIYTFGTDKNIQFTNGIHTL